MAKRKKDIIEIVWSPKNTEVYYNWEDITDNSECYNWMRILWLEQEFTESKYNIDWVYEV
jgi:hypothetical protein